MCIKLQVNFHQLRSKPSILRLDSFISSQPSSREIFLLTKFYIVVIGKYNCLLSTHKFPPWQIKSSLLPGDILTVRTYQFFGIRLLFEPSFEFVRKFRSEAYFYSCTLLFERGPVTWNLNVECLRGF